MTIPADHSMGPPPHRRKASISSTPNAWFVALCMVVIASSLGVVLYTQVGLALGEAGWAAFACLVTMVLAEFYTLRTREKAGHDREIRQIANNTQGLSREVGQLSQKLQDNERLVSRRVRETVDARLGVLLDDMSSIETLLRELSGEVKEIKEEQARRAAASPASAPAPQPVPEPQAAQPSPRRAEAPAPVAEAGPPPAAAAPERDPALAKSIAFALRNDQVDVNLQAVVALPQRRPVHYEALARLRGQNGETILPTQFLAEARHAGLVARLDAAVIRKCLRIAEQIIRREPGASVFCNIDPESLRGSAAMSLLEMLEKDRTAAGLIVFELTAEAFEALGPVEHETMEALVELGCRFSLDNLKSLALDGAKLSHHHVRFLKVDASVLLDPDVESGDIHPSDFARLMARSGIDVVVTRVQAEAQVLDVLDFDVPLAQGHLFGRPRPVRLAAPTVQAAAG